MLRKTLLTIVLLLILSSSAPCYAATLKAGDNVSISASKDINDDVYAAGNTITAQTPIKGDLVCAGNTVSVNEAIEGSLMAGASNITVNAPIGRSVRVGGAQLTVIDSIGTDLLFGGATLAMSSGSVVGRDALVAGGALTLDGTIKRNVKASGGTVTINGTVNGNVEIESDDIQIGNNAVIKGNLTYKSNKTANIASGAKIEGQTIRKPKPVQREDRSGKAIARAGWFIVSYLAAFLLGVMLLLVFPGRTRNVVQTMLSNPLSSLGIGFVALIVVPIAIVILLIFVVTIPISIIVLALYLFILYAAKVYAGLALGRFASDRFAWNLNDYLALLIGLLVVMLLGAIPYLGGLVRFIYMLLGIGAFSMSIYAMIKAGMSRNAQAAPVATDAVPEVGPSE